MKITDAKIAKLFKIFKNERVEVVKLDTVWEQNVLRDIRNKLPTRDDKLNFVWRFAWSSSAVSILFFSLCMVSGGMAVEDWSGVFAGDGIIEIIALEEVLLS